ncbi:MAG: transcription-repair coupling factor [Thermodesulfobacteriota bacterium]
MQELLKAIDALRPGQGLTATGLRTSSAAWLAARCPARPIMFMVAGEDEMNSLVSDLQFFTKRPVLPYPSFDIPPYTPLNPDPQTAASRLAALYTMAEQPGAIMVATSDALLRRTLPASTLQGLAELIISGEDCDQQGLIDTLTRGGYDQVSLVVNSGEFTVRGGIIDIFAPPFTHGGQKTPPAAPLRLDFFGDTVESIRYFDPISQRSIKEIDETIILPVHDVLYPAGDEALARLLSRFTAQAEENGWDRRETGRIKEQLAQRSSFPGIEFFLPLFYEETRAVTDFLPEDTLLIDLEPASCQQTMELTWERITANFQAATAKDLPALAPDQLFVGQEQLKEAFAPFRQLRLTDFVGPDEEVVNVASSNHRLLQQNLELARSKQGLMATLVDHFTEILENKGLIVLSCRSSRHLNNLAEILAGYSLETVPLTPPFAVNEAREEAINLLPEPLSHGFGLPGEGVNIFSELELFGEKRISRRRTKRHPAAGEPVSFEQLTEEDLVVHTTHGIGVYQGITTMAMGELASDFLIIAYKGRDKLYVPIDRLATVSKYKGLSDKKPKIDALGSGSWAKTKSKVKEAVWKVAQDLLKLYAKRQIADGHAFTPPGEMYNELTDSFAYEETTGQSEAIGSCLDDLTSGRTMDRLVCGDVGYGKTEVAIRAAFKVVEDGYQVALLVPTTVLAEQHAESFKERFSGLAVRVESLNRFRSRKEQSTIISDLAAGKVDVIIGTHRLLSKDVVFKGLGLLIIDEEHRFGVVHKEKIKKIRQNIDVLTLTATPIPRTLQLSLLGVRDLSVISSPPSHRRTVKTFVARQDDLVIKEAIIREMQRGGQVFFVHNRVQSIHEQALRIQELVPEARLAVAHGQMPVKALEEIMVDFVGHRVDVLVCTTIIESGLDIPNANTIIITRADRLGLAGIYQLRGRVGRSRQQAYAYLLVPSLEDLSKDAKRRLRALMDYNELGGGFKLAMSDLQIRGGGNILGESQSGTIAAVGYDLYLDLLQKTVEDLKRGGGKEPEIPDFEPEINLQVSARIPPAYIPDPEQRYIAYRKITSVTSEEGLVDLSSELRDRYGPLPPETENLLAIVQLKIPMRPLAIAKLEQGPGRLALTFLDQTPVTPEQILLMIKSSGQRLRLTPDNLLVMETGTRDSQMIFNAARTLLQELGHNAMDD